MRRESKLQVQTERIAKSEQRMTTCKMLSPCKANLEAQSTDCLTIDIANVWQIQLQPQYWRDRKMMVKLMLSWHLTRYCHQDPVPGSLVVNPGGSDLPTLGAALNL